MRSKYVKVFGSILLSAALLLTNNVGTITSKAAEDAFIVQENGEEIVVSGEEMSSFAVMMALDDSEKTQLGVPTGLEWTDDWTIKFNTVENVHNAYWIIVYKDGQQYASRRYATSEYERDVFSAGMSEDINDSGVYTFTVQSMNTYDPDNFSNSEVSAPSAEKVYVKPDVSLGTTVGYWDEETVGKFHVPLVENAGGYQIRIYQTPEGSDRELARGSVTSYKNFTDEWVYDFTERIERYGAGKYRVTVRALSANIEEIANGVEGDYSDYYSTIDNATVVGGAIEEAMKNEDANAAVEALKSAVEQDNLQNAMQTSDSVLEQMKELEKKYAEQNNIAVNPPAVSEEASELVKAEDISMVGAGLNVDAGEVKLEVAVPEQKESISGEVYAKSVQLDIQLKNDNESIHELEVPITITMPIPTGLEAKHLVILHYLKDGSVEQVNLKDNGNGTVTFTVTEFSTFVFAEKIPVSTGSGSCSDSDDGAVSDWNEITVNVDWNAAGAKLDEALAAGNGQNVDVLTGKDMKVSVDVLQKLAGKNAVLALQQGKGIALSVSGKDNQQIKGVLDLVVTDNNSIPEAAKNAVVANSVYNKNITIQENAPLTAVVNLHVGVPTSCAGKVAKLYCYDGKSGKMNLKGSFVVNAAGQSMFRVSQAGQYVLVVE